MKIEHLAAIKSLAEQRDAAVSRWKRLKEEPLRLVLGKGSGELEVLLTEKMQVTIRGAALVSVWAEITDLEHRLRSYGVTLPGDPPPDTPPDAAPPAAAAMPAS